MWQNLAPELVFGIFHHFLPGLKLSVTEPVQFPWYLGHICSQWRDVFISYPAFWNNFVIHFKRECCRSGEPRAMDVDANHALAILNACLPRSGNCPFSFKLVLYSCELCYNSDQNLKSRCGLQILELLVGQSTQWHDADIELHESGLPVLYIAKDKFPRLHSMRVVLWLPAAGIMGDPSPTYADLFENTPQLRCLHLCEFTSWRVDWSCLTVVHLWCPHRLAMHLDQLSGISRLEELNIYGRSWFLVLPVATPLTFPYLKILRIDSEHIRLLFHAPMLQELCIIKKLTYVAPSQTNGSFSDIISIYLPFLLHLTKLILCTENTGDVKALLQYMPPVPDLCLYHCASDYARLASGHPTEYCLYTCTGSILRLLSESPKARSLKSLTVGLLQNDKYYLADIIVTWMKRKSLPVGGVHRFDKLEHLSLVFDAWDDTHFFDVLEQMLGADGIPTSVRKINNEDDSIILDFLQWRESVNM